MEAAIESYDRRTKRSGCCCGRELPLEEVVVAARAGRGQEGRMGSSDGSGWIEHSARRISSRNPEHARPNLSAVLRRAAFGLE